MIDYIDYEKRLTCEEHIALLYYSLKYKKEVKDYSEFQITESLINEYNAIENRPKREVVAVMVEENKKCLDEFRRNYADRIWEYEKPVIWSDRRKSDYYIKQLTASHQFEVYIDHVFRINGYDIGLFYGRSQQYKRGETEAGIEIKCDMKLQETGNVYIEYQERINSNGEWVNSGILKEDETRYFLIGTIQEYFILPRGELQAYYNRLVQNGERIAGARLVQEKAHLTSKGFILSRAKAADINMTVEEVIGELRNRE